MTVKVGGVGLSMDDLWAPEQRRCEQVRRGDRFHKVVPWRATAAGTAERPATARNRTHRRRTARRSTMLRGWALIEGLFAQTIAQPSQSSCGA